MKFKNFILALGLIAALPIGVALAGGNELAYFKIQQLTTLSADTVASGDYIAVYDASADKVKKVDAQILPLGSMAGLYETVAATNVLTTAECGKTMTLSHATEFVSTLPAATAGCTFKFIVANAPETASYTIVTASSANVLIGQVYTLDVNSGTDPDFEATGGDTLTLVDAKAVIGDSVDCVSDGTNWYCNAFVSVFDAATITTAS